MIAACRDMPFYRIAYIGIVIPALLASASKGDLIWDHSSRLLFAGFEDSPFVSDIQDGAGGFSMMVEDIYERPIGNSYVKGTNEALIEGNIYKSMFETILDTDLPQRFYSPAVPSEQ